MQDVIGVFTAFLVAAVPLALIVTKVVDTIRNLVDAAGKLPKFTWNIVALAAGLGVAIGWQYNLVSALSHAIPALTSATSFDGITGQLLTGLAIGAMAGFWHEKMDLWSSAAKANRAKARGGGTTLTTTAR